MNSGYPDQLVTLVNSGNPGNIGNPGNSGNSGNPGNYANSDRYELWLVNSGGQFWLP